LIVTILMIAAVGAGSKADLDGGETKADAQRFSK